MNVAYGKPVFVTHGDRGLPSIGYMVDGKYDDLSMCHMVKTPSWVKVDLGYWYRVTRVHLTLGDVGEYSVFISNQTMISMPPKSLPFNFFLRFESLALLWIRLHEFYCKGAYSKCNCIISHSRN